MEVKLGDLVRDLVLRNKGADLCVPQSSTGFHPLCVGRPANLAPQNASRSGVSEEFMTNYLISAQSCRAPSPELSPGARTTDATEPEQASPNNRR